MTLQADAADWHRRRFPKANVWHVHVKRSPIAAGSTPLARTPLSRSAGGLKRGKGLAVESVERKREDATEWPAVKAIVWARDNGECQAKRLVPEVACSQRLDPHHRHPTGAGGPRLDPDNVLTLCSAHHFWVHQEDPIRARLLGLLV